MFAETVGENIFAETMWEKIYLQKLRGIKGYHVNPITPRKAKIVYNFGLSECNRVKGRT